jgi:hypothetical protein
MSKQYNDEGLVLIYNKFENNQLTELKRESRSLVIDKTTLQIKAYSCETPLLNLEKENVPEDAVMNMCYEGTLISVFHHNDKWYASTRRCLNSNNSIFNITELNVPKSHYQMFEEVLSKTEYSNFDNFSGFLDKSKSYYLPANGIYIKLNDFGYSLNLLDKNSTLENEIENSVDNLFETNNNFRDIYTFFFDLYNGPDIGSQSFTTIIKNNIKDKIKQTKLLKIIKKEIGKYFNYKTIDKIQSKNPSILDWKWNISESKLLNDIVKKPQDYFNKTNVFDHFTLIPKTGRIVNIIN